MLTRISPQLSEIARFTDDVEAMTAFYELLLGDPVVADDGIALFDVDGVKLLIHETYEPEAGVLPAEDHVSVAVEDVDATFESLTEAGVEAFRDPEDHEWGRSAYFRDPDGELIEITEE